LVVDEHYVKTNSLIYVGPSFVTVVGATWTPDTALLLAKQIRQLTSRPVREVINTSPDPEWSGGNAYWKRIGAKVVAAGVTCTSLRSSWDATVETVRKNFPDYPQLRLSEPAACHRENFDLQRGNIQVLYLGPSHTAADVFVYFPKEKVLDAGSILKEQVGNLAKADVQEYPKTLRKLQALHLDIKTVVSGHWSPIHGPDLIERYLGFLEQWQQTPRDH
jgi:metallo-beta-lactamase class B